MTPFDFTNLLILDLANNHQGDMKHAKEIISRLGKVVAKTGMKAGIKFQFRQLETFIHPDYKERKDVKHIPRFMETVLQPKQYKELANAIWDAGMVTICTPFDEESVDIINDLGIDIIKIASCSALDMPLLHKAVQGNKPMIVSTAGVTESGVDKMVSFLQSHHAHFALMHCVGIYPTPNNMLRLNRIDRLKGRYPNIPVGFSTHEDPENMDPVKISFAKGARLFERHVGLEAGPHKLNKYSSSPEQIERWINALKTSMEICGGEHASPPPQAETDSLRTLMRGVYAAKAIKKGDKLTRDKVFFAMPLQDGQLVSGEWSEGMAADKDYAKLEAVNASPADIQPAPEDLIYSILLQVQGIMNQARIFVRDDCPIELSHHFGLERFREYGAAMVTCINREYCKKLIIQLPRQKHPYHFHKKKEETFQLLYGDLEVELDGHKHKLELGDTLLVSPGQWHKFHTLHGAIFEEVSTTHYNDDSFYGEDSIKNMPREKRKTVIESMAKAIANPNL